MLTWLLGCATPMAVLAPVHSDCLTQLPVRCSSAVRPCSPFLFPRTYVALVSCYRNWRSLIRIIASSALACRLAYGLQIEQFGDFVACNGARFGAQAYE